MYNLNDLDMIFRKYEFSSEAQAKQMVDALGEEHKHSIAYLGNIVLVAGDENTAPVISDKYHIDVLWNSNAPADWTNYEVWCPPVGVHIFGNSQAVKEWTEKCKELHPEYFPEPDENII